MPRRNLFVLILATIVALCCYPRIQRNPYGRVLANTMAMIESRALEPVGAEKLFEGAMSGMIGQLDDYSAFIPPQEAEAFHEAIDMEFGGVGMEVVLDPQSKEFMVLSPLVGSPAYKAGIRAGDKILRIDDSSTQGMSMQDAINLLRGKPGEAVTLTVLHEGEEKPVEITIVREKIQVDTVLGDTRNADGSWNFLLEGQPGIGYIRITGFTDKTVEDMRQAILWLTRHNMRGLVLDLRDNPGGYVAAAIAVCDMLIPSGVIVTTRGREGRIYRAYTATGLGQFIDFPMAVLVNQQSASAAEIVAACLQDHGRAVVIGQRSFGKGTIQDVMELEQGCGAMKITTASYWRPNGKNIHRPRDAGEKDEWGVLPNEGYTVAIGNDEQNNWRLWRFHRDAAPSQLKNGNGKASDKGDAKKSDASFVDRPLARAVEFLDKETHSEPPADSRE